MTEYYGYFRPYIETETEWRKEKLTAVQIAALKIVAHQTAVHIDLFGGYPAQVVFISDDLIAIAAVEGHNEPDLTVMKTEEYVAQNQWCLDEEQDEPEEVVRKAQPNEQTGRGSEAA